MSKAKDIGSAVLIPLSVGITSGVVANQFPQSRKKSKTSVEPLRGKVKKFAGEPLTSENPDFNHKAANSIYSAIMKMDDETAFEFCHHIISNNLEMMIQKNLPQFQQSLDRIFAKNEMAVRRTIAKMATEDPKKAELYADAYGRIRKAGEWDESLYRRDTRGRFSTKVKPVPAGSKPIHETRAKQLHVDIDTTTDAYKNLNNHQKAQAQAEYAQISQFLQTVQNSMGGGNPGDLEVTYAIERVTSSGLPTGSGVSHTKTFGTTPPEDLILKPNTRIVGVEAKHQDLHANQHAYNLQTTLDLTGPVATQFSNDWLNEGDSRNSVDYGRVAVASSLLGLGAQKGSKRDMASRVGNYVGEHGSEAEEVFGPTARRTAYRYRGTEKTPDAHLVNLYDRTIMREKMAEADDEAEFTGRSIRGVRAPRAAKSTMQMAEQREAAKNRPPDWSERRAGRRVLTDQLRFQVPSFELYSLQVGSGNTPPSEGVIIDKNGKIVTQAVGYGDDHYLPFNLKNLKHLRGGEYVRTRSVGGPTSEDIYVGLMSGARAITVVSRSGTYTVQFHEDFKGGRRYNDKALRMTRRYQQILDAVQSGKVEKAPVPEPIKQKIAERVRRENPWENNNRIKIMIEEEIKEYKKHPELTDEDKDYLSDLAKIKMAVNPQMDEADALKEARATVTANKGIYFKLDAQGYADALDALREQFPYYIKKPIDVKIESPRGNTISTERDKGYVEPGRNRPTEARAGWFGTEENPGAKFSASRANYQRGIYDKDPESLKTRGGKLTPKAAEGETATEGKTEGKKFKSLKEATEAAAGKTEKADAAYPLAMELIRRGMVGDPVKAEYPFFKKDSADLRAHLRTPEGLAEFQSFLDAKIEGDPDAEKILKMPEAASVREALSRYRGAGAKRETFDRKQAHVWGKTPYVFKGPEFEADAPQERREAALMALSRETPSLHDAGDLAVADDVVLQRELETLNKIRDIVNSVDLDDSDPGQRQELLDASLTLVGRHDHYTMEALQMKPERITDRMVNIQKIRSLKAMSSTGSDPGSKKRKELFDLAQAEMTRLAAAIKNDAMTGELEARRSLMAELNQESGAQGGWDFTKMTDHQVEQWLKRVRGET